MVDVNSFNDSWDSFESPALPDLTKRVSKLVNSEDTHKDIDIEYVVDEFSVEGEVKDV